MDSIVPIVGIGASAGGLDAFKKFFSHASIASGFHFVVIQHLSHAYASVLRNLIAQNTRFVSFVIAAYLPISLLPLSLEVSDLS